MNFDITMIEERFNNEKLLIGQQIKEIRNSKSMSQLELAVTMGIDRSEISKYENGKNNLELRTIIKFAIAFGVETKELFDF